MANGSPARFFGVAPASWLLLIGTLLIPATLEAAPLESSEKSPAAGSNQEPEAKKEAGANKAQDESKKEEEGKVPPPPVLDPSDDAVEKDPDRNGRETPPPPVPREEGDESSDDDSEPAPEDAPAKKDPTAEWLKRLLKKKGAEADPEKAPPPIGKPRPKTSKAASKEEKSGQERVDPRAPYNAKAEQMFRKARALAAQGDWKAPLELIQHLFEQPDDSLCRLPDGKWGSLRVEALKFLGTMPRDVRERYGVQFEGAARQRLREGMRAENPDIIAEVALRYFHTEAGFEAANFLGSRHFDRGEFGMATHWFQLLLAAHAPLTQSPPWKLKASMAARSAGQTSLAADLMKDLEPDSSKAGGRILVGGKSVEPGKWFAEAQKLRFPAGAPLDEWPLFYGTPRRDGIASGSAPLLLKRWSAPTSLNLPIQNQLTQLLDDLSIQGFSPLPAFFPVMVGGKVVFRTLHGVQVVDAETGRPLWETPDEISAERLLALSALEDSPASAQQVMVTFGRNAAIASYYGGSAEYHPLTNLLYRNANYGILSSDADGRRLYVVEDQPILSHRQPGQVFGDDASDSDTFGRSLSTNKLSAYDLQTGRSLWEVGGPIQNDPFELPLAGHFLFGAPLEDGDDLFVVGEKETEIRLFVLDPRTGAEKWSQLLGYAETKIESDVVRQWWTSQVAVGDGVIICPTTVGWLVAVDRQTHSLLWAYRYAPEKRKPERVTNGMGQEAVPLTQLSDRWSPAPPIIAGNRVLYTPLEESVLVCVNMQQGTRIWQKPREDFLYVAGVFENLALLVGPSRVSAVDLDRGSSLWSLPLDNPTDRPAGRGVFVGGRYYLPMASGMLVSIDLKSGKIVERSYLAPADNPVSYSLGNLAMYRGMLVSLSARGLTAFEPRDAVEQEIRERLEADASDARANLRSAEVESLNRNHDRSLAALHRIRVAELSEDLRPRYDALLRETLVAMVSADLENRDAEWAELSALAGTETEKFEIARLNAERHAARTEFAAAFEAYLTLVESALATNGAKAGALIPSERGSAVHVQGDLWLSGRMSDLRRAAGDAASAAFDRRVATLAEQASGAGIASLEKFNAIFGFHPASIPIKRQLFEARFLTGEFLAAENILFELRGQPAAAAESLGRLAQLMQKFDLAADAAHFQRLLERDYPDTTIANGTTVAAVIEKLRMRGALPDESQGGLPDWGSTDLSVIKSAVNYTPISFQELTVPGRGLPYFRNHRLQLHPLEQRFAVVNAVTEVCDWFQPLRSKAESMDDGLTSMRVTGHQVVLLHRGILHCLSPVERKVVWAHPLDDGPGPVQYGGMIHRGPPQAFAPATAGQLLDRLARETAGSGPLCVANNRYVCYQARRKLVVLDALTGTVRWKRDGVQLGSVVQGDEEVLYVISPDHSKAMALRAIDGKELPAPQLTKAFTNAVHLYGKDLVMAEPNPGTGRKKLTMRLFDPIENHDLWKLEIPGGTLVTAVAPDLLALLSPAGQFEVLDLKHGQLRTFGSIPADEFKPKVDASAYAFADYDNIYLVVNHRSNQSHYSEGTPSLPVHGKIRAYDPIQGAERWSRPIVERNLVIEHLDHSPILVFAERKYQKRSNTNVWSLAILALDKQTGRTLLDTHTPSQAGFQNLSVNLAEKYVELRSYNERIRLVPKSVAESLTAP